MPMGYLRVLNPEPPLCLDLAAWRKYCGFDLSGAECKLDINIDSETLMMKVELYEDMPDNPADSKAICDYYGGEVAPKRVAGPFPCLRRGSVTLSADPRRK
jgi:hypothetical protein